MSSDKNAKLYKLQICVRFYGFEGIELKYGAASFKFI